MFSCFVLQSRRPSFCPINESEDREGAEDYGKTAVVFSLKNEVGCLVQALRLFQVRRHTRPRFTSSVLRELRHILTDSSSLPNGSFLLSSCRRGE